MTPRRILTIAVAGGLLALSCGDDPEPLTKEEFVEQADAICASTQDEIDAIFEEVWTDVENADVATEEEGEAYVFVRFGDAFDEAQPIIENQIADLRALNPPEADEELVQSLLDDFEDGVSEFGDLLDAAADGDETAMAALDGDDPLVDVDQRAREYGMVVCGARDA
jgi:hypothetical protein